MAKNSSKSESRESRIYIIAGKDTAIVNNHFEQLIDKLLEPDRRATGLFVADSDRTSAAEILDELRTLPFLSDKRVVAVKQADKFITNNRRLLEAYFDNPCETGILVMTVNSFPARTKLARKLAQVGELISLSEPKSWQLPGRLKQYAKDAHGKKLSGEAAEFLVALAGDQLGRLYAEIDKLALFAADEREITAEHVEQLIGKGRLYSIFNTIDSAVAGRGGDAAVTLREVFEQDRTAQYTFVGAFAFHLRRMFNGRAMLDAGLRDSQVISKLRIWHGKEAFMAQLKKLTLGQIGRLITELARIDFAVKTGRVNPKTAAEQLVLRLATF